MFFERVNEDERRYVDFLHSRKISMYGQGSVGSVALRTLDDAIVCTYVRMFMSKV